MDEGIGLRQLTVVFPPGLRRHRSYASPHFGRFAKEQSYKYLVRLLASHSPSELGSGLASRVGCWIIILY